MSVLSPEEIGLREEGEGAPGPAPSSPSIRQAIGLAAAVIGLLVAVVACGGGPLLALTATGPGAPAPTGAAIQQPLGLTVLGVWLGLIVAVEGWRVWQGRPSRPFRPRYPGLLWLLLVSLIVVGGIASLSEALTTYLLPPVNTLAMALLPLLVLTTVGRLLDGRGGTGRDAVVGLVSGASVGPIMALLIEGGAVLIIIVAALLLGLLPMEALQSLQARLNDPAFLADPWALLDSLSPVVVLVALFLFSVVTPLAEETMKTLGVGLAGRWLRPAPARAFLLGVAAGAGFALIENVLNGALVSEIWGLNVVGRLAATVMHCATGGLMGWGWGQAWTARRPARLALAFVVANVLHGLWNGLAVGLVFSGLVLLDNPADWQGRLMLVGLMLGLLAALGTVILGASVGLLWASRTLGRSDSP